MPTSFESLARPLEKASNLARRSWEPVGSSFHNAVARPRKQNQRKQTLAAGVGPEGQVTVVCELSLGLARLVGYKRQAGVFCAHPVVIRLAAQRLRACADKASETLNILKNQTKETMRVKEYCAAV